MFSVSSSARNAPLPAYRLQMVGLGTLTLLMDLYRQRQALKGLDAHLLADIGVTAAEAEQEAARPLWDVPGNWRL